jgi:hypothetical protein
MATALNLSALSSGSTKSAKPETKPSNIVWQNVDINSLGPDLQSAWTDWHSAKDRFTRLVNEKLDPPEHLRYYVNDKFGLSIGLGPRTGRRNVVSLADLAASAK